MAEYDRYVDRQVVVSGEVIDTTPVTIRATGTYGEQTRFRLRGGRQDVAVGDYLSVAGVVRPGNEIAVTGTVHKPASAYWRTRVLSLLAGLLVLGRALRHWRIDSADRSIRIRDAPPSSKTTDTEGGDA